MISNGRQQISQSVVNRWNGTVVSMTVSNTRPQNGHCMDSETSTKPLYALHGGSAKNEMPAQTVARWALFMLFIRHEPFLQP